MVWWCLAACVFVFVFRSVLNNIGSFGFGPVQWRLTRPGGKDGSIYCLGFFLLIAHIFNCFYLKSNVEASFFPRGLI